MSVKWIASLEEQKSELRFAFNSKQIFLKVFMQLYVFQICLCFLIVSGSWMENQMHWDGNKGKYWKVILLYIRLKIGWIDSNRALPFRPLLVVYLGIESS